MKPSGRRDVIDKPAFGSPELAMRLKNYDENRRAYRQRDLVGLLHRYLHVISNAMLIKAFMPEVKDRRRPPAAPGVTPESHKRALESMKTCQIGIVGRLRAEIL